MKDDAGHIGWLGAAVGAGATSGFITRALCQPFDVVKIRFQLQIEPLSKSSYESKYRTISQTVTTIVREEGLRGLWKGHSPAQFLSMIYGVVQFGTFETIMKTSGINRERGPLGGEGFGNNGAWQTMAHLGCGAAAGSLATVVSFPFDVLRTRFIAQGNTVGYRWTGEGLSALWRVEGVGGLFRGLAPTLVQAAPYSAGLFAFHHVFTQLFTLFDEKLRIWREICTGAVTGVAAKTLVYPLDLARKRMQLQGFQQYRKGFGKNFTCHGLYHCLKLTVKEEGYNGLFKGLTPSWLKAAATTALYFTIYNETFRYLDKNTSNST